MEVGGECEGLGKMGRGVDIRGESSQNREVRNPVPTKQYFLIFGVFLESLIFVLLLSILFDQICRRVFVVLFFCYIYYFFSSVFSFSR